MSKEQVQEAMTLLSKVTVEQIQSVMQVNQETLSLAMRLSKPSPLESKTWSGANLEVDKALQFGEGPEVFEPFEAYRHGTKAWKGVLQMRKLNNRELGALEREHLDKSSKYHEAVLKASQKIGIPKTTADINADSLMRTTFNYFLKLGISGAYGSTVSACSSQIDHPIFGHGAVVGVVVGSLFNLASLASTGDWSRFGENTGVIDILPRFSSSSSLKGHFSTMCTAEIYLDEIESFIPKMGS
ncbi:hypothetical protein IWW34DRAFT_641246 [Fusarium oxysporum f. sp. albedinis]|nr:hypothetical protein IWW34DRAFT_641246 [Fusarium oxysporum f. sp. albedinis]